jgi:hypothetical protein
MADITQTLQDYYSNLLILQYHNKPKAVATIKALAGLAAYDGLPFAVRDAFDINTASGKQLDVLGKYIGFSRFASLLVIQNFFKYNIGQQITAINGYNVYSAGLIKSRWLTYEGLPSADYPLGDEDLRLCLKLKLLVNSGAAITSLIKNELWALFGNTIALTDSRDLSYTYHLANIYEEVLPVILAYDLLPAPMGITYDIEVEKGE